MFVVPRYQVRFNRDVRGCTYQATLGGVEADHVVASGFASAESAAAQGGPADGVRVISFDADPAGASVPKLAQRPFHLLVVCCAQRGGGLPGGACQPTAGRRTGGGRHLGRRARPRGRIIPRCCSSSKV